MRPIRLLLVPALLAMSFGARVSAQPSQLPAEREAILGYMLTLPRANQLIDAMVEMNRYVMANPAVQERIQLSMMQSPDERLREMEGDAQVMAILKRHGLTAREFQVGIPTLRMAVMAAQGGPAASRAVASQMNINFAKANLAQLQRRLDAADGRRPARR